MRSLVLLWRSGSRQDIYLAMEVKQQVLANRDIRSLAMESLRDWARGRNVALAYFNFRRRRGAFMSEYVGCRT